MINTKNTDILIFGAGLTGLTMAYYLKKAGRKVILIEGSDRTGGVIETISEDGFTYETGPNTGVLSTPEIAELFEDLNGHVDLETPGSASGARWIWKKGQWHALPSGLVDAVRTPLFSSADKLRILAEPFKRKGKDPDENVADLVRRRLGPTYLDYAVDPFISGIYAGDPDRLITRHALPKLYRLEQEHGSFIRGAIKKQFSGKDEREKKATRKVFSVKGGLQRLTDAMAALIGNENILLSCRKTSIKPSSDLFDIEVETTSSAEKIQIQAKTVVTTVGSHALSGLLEFIPADQLEPVTNLSYAKVVQVAAGFKKWNGIPIPAFGGLIPSREKRKALGILFPSSIFDNRAPEGGALLSIFMGGIKNPDLVSLGDKELEILAVKEIRETLKTGETTPDLIRIFRYEHAIPQYEITTEERLKAVKKILESHPGLILAGNIRDGIGMADRVKQAKQIAEEIIR